jgi:hypothetical protein
MTASNRALLTTSPLVVSSRLKVFIGTELPLDAALLCFARSSVGFFADAFAMEFRPHVRQKWILSNIALCSPIFKASLAAAAWGGVSLPKVLSKRGDGDNQPAFARWQNMD